MGNVYPWALLVCLRGLVECRVCSNLCFGFSPLGGLVAAPRSVVVPEEAAV